MSEEHETEQGGRIPIMQRVLDNPFILLFIGIAIPALTYVVWGVMELIAIPVSR